MLKRSPTSASPVFESLPKHPTPEGTIQATNITPAVPGQS